MKPIYLVRRHRLAPKHYQGKHRKVPAYAKEYEVMLVTPDVSLANKRKRELDVNPSLGTHNFKYSILRMKLTVGTNADCDFEK